MNWLFIISKIKETSASHIAQIAALATLLLVAYPMRKLLIDSYLQNMSIKSMWQVVKLKRQLRKEAKKNKKKFSFTEGWGCLVTILLIALVIWGIAVLVKWIVNMI
jgi:hypothetical protein